MTIHPILIQPEGTYFHFLSTDRRLGYDDGRLVEVGQTLRVEGQPILCKHGFHASKRSMDALKHASGPTACLVTLGGILAHAIDESVAQERTVIWMYDASRLLREFACDVAENALLKERAAGHEYTPLLWNAIEVMRRFLRGEATEEEKKQVATGETVGELVWDCTGDVIQAIAWATTTQCTPIEAAYTVTYIASQASAYLAAESVTGPSKWNTDVESANSTFNRQLTQMLLRAGQVSKDA